MEKEHGEHRTLAWASEVGRPAVRESLERPEDAILDAHGGDANSVSTGIPVLRAQGGDPQERIPTAQGANVLQRASSPPPAALGTVV
jgi:hypothetical protein